MDDAKFWSLIDRARGGSAPQLPSANDEELRRVLEALPIEDVQAFGRKFYELLCDLNNWRLWGVGYVMAGGMSDDSFHYFRSWIIGKGQDCVKSALADPDGVSDFVEDGCELENELLEYVAVEVCEAAGVDDPRDAGERFPDDLPPGEPFDEDSVHELYPKALAVARRLENWE